MKNRISIYAKPADVSPEARAKLSNHHNTAAGDIVASIVKPIVELKGTEGDALVLLESVVMGVFMTMDQTDELRRLEMLANNVAARLYNQRREATKH